MSLGEFVRQPIIKEAFKKFATKDRTPKWLRSKPILVPHEGSLNWTGRLGTAFDFLARFHLARQLHGTPVQIAHGGLAAEFLDGRYDSAVLMDDSIIFTDSDADSPEGLKRARIEVTAYIEGDGNISALADKCELLGQLAIYHRGNQHNPVFSPFPETRRQLLSLMEVFDANVSELMPHSVCFLSASFDAGDLVGGAVADLVVDDRLIEIKTTKTACVTLDMLLQISGYAALQRMGGLSMNGVSSDTDFSSLEIYFARYGALVRWSIDELFPGDGFDRFCQVFEAVAGAPIAKNKSGSRSDNQPSDRIQCRASDQFRLSVA